MSILQDAHTSVQGECSASRQPGGRFGRKYCRFPSNNYRQLIRKGDQTIAEAGFPYAHVSVMRKAEPEIAFMAAALVLLVVPMLVMFGVMALGLAAAVMAPMDRLTEGHGIWM